MERLGLRLGAKLTFSRTVERRGAAARRLPSVVLRGRAPARSGGSASIGSARTRSGRGSSSGGPAQIRIPRHGAVLMPASKPATRPVSGAVSEFVADRAAWPSSGRYRAGVDRRGARVAAAAARRRRSARLRVFALGFVGAFVGAHRRRGLRRTRGDREVAILARAPPSRGSPRPRRRRRRLRRPSASPSLSPASPAADRRRARGLIGLDLGLDFDSNSSSSYGSSTAAGEAASCAASVALAASSVWTCSPRSITKDCWPLTVASASTASETLKRFPDRADGRASG